LPEFSKRFDDPTCRAIERAAGNTCIGGFMSIHAIISCCCCFGKCCTEDPEDVFG
jgi:hypothetical protein